jgi:hypothetical protein
MYSEASERIGDQPFGLHSLVPQIFNNTGSLSSKKAKRKDTHTASESMRFNPSRKNIESERESAVKEPTTDQYYATPV